MEEYISSGSMRPALSVGSAGCTRICLCTLYCRAACAHSAHIKKTIVNGIECEKCENYDPRRRDKAVRMSPVQFLRDREIGDAKQGIIISDDNNNKKEC